MDTSFLNNLFKPSIRIYEDIKDEWRWTLRVGSITIGASSEGYKNKADCISNILNVEKRIRELRLENKIN